MRRLLEIFLGIKPAPWAEGGSWRLEWLSMPKHDKLLVLQATHSGVTLQPENVPVDDGLAPA